MPKEPAGEYYYHPCILEHKYNASSVFGLLEMLKMISITSQSPFFKSDLICNNMFQFIGCFKHRDFGLAVLPTEINVIS